MIFFIHLFALALVLVPAVAFGQDRSFVPLTSIPGFQQAGNSPDITTFLNQLYKICIGAAAGLAVLQIIRAGILFMTNKGSVSENEQARTLLQGAILGLILVLSPIIVFGIINPKILELNFSADRLETEAPTSPGPEAPPSVITGTGEVNTACPQIQNGQRLDGQPNQRFLEDCCARQTSETVSCRTDWVYGRNGQSSQLYCRCSNR